LDDDSIANKVNTGYAAAVSLQYATQVCGASHEIFVPSNKAAGTRIRGLELLRTYLEASLKKPMEEAGLFIFDTCRDWLRTVPVLPRDDRELEDVDSGAEDHAYDDTRYRLIHKRVIPFSMDFRL
jgi:hypothetical protein